MRYACFISTQMQFKEVHCTWNVMSEVYLIHGPLQELRDILELWDAHIIGDDCKWGWVSAHLMHVLAVDIVLGRGKYKDGLPSSILQAG